MKKLLTLRLFNGVNNCGRQEDVGRISYKKTNCSLFNSRKEIIIDYEIINFLKFLEKDRWFFYVVNGGADLGEKELINVDVKNVLESRVCRINRPHN